jgi:acetylornithine deacetylase/succinyl-diaminopimelate desuccinylase-like protein
LRFVVGVDPKEILPALRRHLDRHGFGMVQITSARDSFFNASRTDPDNVWVQWAAESIAQTTGKKPAVLPNIGGGLPNDIFMEVLNLSTVWVPHSFAGCSQHAPNEHLPPALLREGLGIMTGLYWDIANGPNPDNA